jgi:predicted PurR-regulated permease PerM
MSPKAPLSRATSGDGRWQLRPGELPWKKWAIWGLFLLLMWALRDLFFILFLTFVLTYVLRSVVTWAMHRLGRTGDRPWVERTLSLATFALFLVALYGIGSFLGPRMVRQGEALVERVSRVDAQQQFDEILAKTVGAYLFRRQYGEPGEPPYERALGHYRQEGLRVQMYQDFPAHEAAIEGPFVGEVIARERARMRDELGTGGVVDRDFRRWFIEERAPELYERDRRRLVADWETRYRESADGQTLSLAEARREPGFAARRDQQVLDRLFDEALQDAGRRAALSEEWMGIVADRLATEIAREPIDQQPGFAAYFEQRRRLDPAALPYTYDQYLALERGYAEGEAAFSAALATIAPTRSEEVERRDFEASQQRNLARHWAAGPLAAQLREMFGHYLASQASSLGAWIRQKIGVLVSLPFQIGLALVLSFFITFDIPKLRRSLRRLEASRLHDAYHEIAPSLASFGKLMGRAFQAQGVIAIVNTVLTWLAIHFLGIQNELVLCLVVFVCSFIPILGVVISSAPIVVMALVQPGGSIFLAGKVIIAVLVVHLIEAMLLNPKIVGDMLHLHPVLVLAVLAIGEHFFGVWGLLLAVPVTVYVLRYVILGEPLPDVVAEEGEPAPAPVVGGADSGDGLSRARETAES